MNTRVIPAPTASVVLKGVRDNALLSLLIAGFADWLFFRHPVGVSVALFICAFVAATAFAHRKLASGRTFWTSVGVLGASLLPIVLHYGLLPLLVALAGASFFLLAATGYVSFDFLDLLQKILRLLIGGPVQMIFDLTRASALLRRSDMRIFGRWQFAAWATTFGLGAVFLLLFSVANPLIQKWLSEIDPLWLLGQLDVARALFWVVCVMLSWPFLRSRLGTKGFRKKKIRRKSARPWTPQAKSTSVALMRIDQLVLPLATFNILFLVQTWLDVTYLWAGTALPAGFTYAEYAHRGAYALIFASALASGFILLIMRSGGEAERAPTIRMLVFVWMAQCTFLVVSSIHRLALYVDIYALTYWRAFALTGMVLIAVGLASIVARIAFHKSNTWLVTVNSAAAAATFYICSLVNVPAVIANYNVHHSLAFAGKGVRLDQLYLCSLGPEALPAIETYISKEGARADYLQTCSVRLMRRHRRQMSNWRGWTFYGWRLTKYLNSQDQANLTRESKD